MDGRFKKESDSGGQLQSRKSTQKRQRQYFQQKKRQQQTFGLDDKVDGTNPCIRYQEKPKSLDILSLLNLATVTHECSSGYIHENPKICSSPSDHQPLNARAKDLPSSTDIATTSSSHEVHKLSPKANLQRNPDDVTSCNAFERNDNKLNNWEIETKDHLSSLVLFDDDGPNEHFGRNQARETHVAFSVEGLGKIGLETPVHSPVRPNRAFSPGYPILNAAKRRHLSKMRDNREHQLNPMVHYVNEPLGDCAMESAFSLKGVGEHSGKLRTSKPSSQGCMPVETTDYQMDNEFGKEWPCDNIVDSEEAWNEWDSPWYMETSTDLFRTTKHDIYGSNFEDSRIKKRSDKDERPGEFDILDSPTTCMKHVSSKNDRNFKAMDAERYCAKGGNHILKTSAWSYFATEDAKESTSLLSEESSSSSAVRRDKAKCSSSSFRVGESMKRDDTVFFKSTAGNYCEEELFWEELGYKKTNINYRKSLKRSERPTMVQNPSGAYTVHSNDLLRTKKDLEFQRTWTWSYEEGCTSADILSDLGSFHNDIKADFAPSEWELYHKDPFSSSPELKLCHNRQTSFKKSKFDDPVECLPSSDRIFEPDSPLCSYNPPMFSNIRSMTKDSHTSCASRTVGELPHSSKITDSQGAKKFCSISRQEGGKHVIGLQPFVYANRLHVAEEEVSVGNNNIPTEAEKTTDGLEDGSNECEVKEESKGSIKSKTSNSSENTGETLSSTKEVSAKQENCPDEKKYPFDAPMAFPSQSGTEGKEELESEIKSQRKGSSGPSYRVMLERYILQLLLVQKVSKESSENCSAKKV